jgi:hypothetical protein
LFEKLLACPITLLELNTLAHVGCAVVMYVIWWHKPQDVIETVKITIDYELATLLTSYRFERDFDYVREDTDSDIFVLPQPKPKARKLRLTSLASFFEWATSRTSYTWEKRMPRNESEKDVLGEPRWTEKAQDLDDEEKEDLVQEALVDARKARKTYGDNAAGVVMLLPGQKLRGIPFRLKVGAAPIYLSLNDIERLTLMKDLQGGRDGPLNLLGGFDTLHPNESGPVSDMLKSGRVLIRRAPNMSIPGNLELSTSRTLAVLAVCGILYGGVHLTAWNSHFPTGIEKLLFRLAATAVTGAGVLLWVAYLVRQILGLNNYDESFVFTLVVLVAVVLIPYGVVAACVARVYLVVEAFMSFRSLPLGAYTTVNWVVFLPHVGT